jgi:hypothetical protein
MKRVLPVIIALAAVAFITIQRFDLCSGEVYFPQEYKSTSFKLRSEVRGSGCSLDWHPLVVFEAAPAESEEWQEVMTGWTDEPNTVPSENQVRFIDERTGYLYFNDQYAVTTDEAKSWSVWQARQYFAQDKEDIFIDKVEVQANGQGWMSLTVPSAMGFHRLLRTRDFGRSWQED